MRRGIFEIYCRDERRFVSSTVPGSKGIFQFPGCSCLKLGCFDNWVRHFAAVDLYFLQVITCSRVLPELIDDKFKCHIGQQQRAGY